MGALVVACWGCGFGVGKGAVVASLMYCWICCCNSFSSLAVDEASFEAMSCRVGRA